MIGHSTREGLSAVGVPGPSRGASGRDERFGDQRRARDSRSRGVTAAMHSGSSRSASAKSSSRSTPSSRRDLRRRTSGSSDQTPAQDGRGKTQRRNRVAGIVLTVAECPLAVFPGFAPVNRGQRNQKAGVSRPRTAASASVTEHASLFERVLARRVVAHAPVANEIRLGRVKVAAGGIDPQRPSGRPVLLPGRQPEGTAEKLCDARVGDRR